MRIAVLAGTSSVLRPLVRLENVQLFSNSSCCFGWPRGLDANDFYQIDDPAQIVFLELLTC
jgi:hypothetical protein